MAEYEDKLRELLGKLFQFEHTDLDFGIYRIMNQKRDDIKRFIDQDLMTIVDRALAEFSSADKERIETEIEELRKKITSSIGEDAFKPNGEIKKEFVDTKLGKEYRAKMKDLENIQVSETTKAEIFNHVYQFFSRYYQDGDFISLRRRSKDSKYSIPYNGEEVFLYWANMDQYYIKTTEYFNNYAFEAQDYRIRFKVVSAEAEQNNNQSDKRFFVLANMDKPVAFDKKAKELLVNFEFRDMTTDEEKKLGKAQDKMNEALAQMILDTIIDKTLKSLLEKKEKEISLILRHLNTYTTRNTSDYFIHKDLESFLKRELDFFIMNEVLDIDLLSIPKESGIIAAKIGAIREISKCVIQFLAQIENFQEMLWEKKKFVVGTEYCMTLNNVPENLYPEILNNKPQIAEWMNLYELAQFEKQLNPLAVSSKKGGFRIDRDYLKSNPSLVIDTKFFDQHFKDRLLASFDNLDAHLGGILIKSDNWQAVNLLQEKYRNKIRCIYIDPPYNTGSDEFAFKDNYQHSSWLSMLYDRISLALFLWEDNGHFFMSVDKRENAKARLLLDTLIPNGLVGDVAVVNNPQGRSDEKHIASAHETLFVYKNLKTISFGWPAEEHITRRYRKRDDDGKLYREVDLRKTGENDRRQDRPNLFYYFYYSEAKKDLFPSRDEKTPAGYIQIKPVRPDGTEGNWRWELDSASKQLNLLLPKPMERRNVWTVYEKDYLDRSRTITPTSVWRKSTFISHEASKIFRELGFEKSEFPHPKAVDMIKHVLLMSTRHDSIVLDHFAGSGTTGHAVIDLNREDGGKRKFILVELGNYFDDVLKPRIEKIIFTSNWKNGVPQSIEGTTLMVKYYSLEQYEDSLNNIEFALPEGVTQKTLFEKKGYFLRYMLDFESRESPCRLNIDKLGKPFDYTMRITENGKIRENVTIDLVETFNYLLGLHVEKIRTFQDKTNKDWYYRVIFGHKDSDKIAIVWRNADDLDLKNDKKFIEKTIIKNVKVDKLYVNGQCYATGAISLEDKFKLAMGGM